MKLMLPLLLALAGPLQAPLSNSVPSPQRGSDPEMFYPQPDTLEGPSGGKQSELAASGGSCGMMIKEVE